MKKLQNDYTTPEQSKRLLELGVPADSANYCYECSLIGGEKYYSRELLDDTTFTEYKRNWESPCVDVIPCWSFGRLIEIISICGSIVMVTRFNINNAADFYRSTESSVVDLTIDDIETLIKSEDIDFSKLEE